MKRFLYSAAFISLLCLNLSAQQNLLQNGCFLDTSSNVWNFNTNGANATRSYQTMQNTNGTVISRKCKIEIIQIGSSENAPQLAQSGITLEEGEGYTLSFIASSSRAGSIKAIIRSNDLVFTDTASVLSTNAAPKKHIVDFFVEKIQGQATLQLNLGRYDGPTNIALDSIFLIKKTTPIIRLVSPSAKEKWITGNEYKIAWTNSGILESVKIQYSTDSGATWKVIAQAATNQKSFWWKVPSTAFGNACKIIVSSTDGKIADTSDAFKIQEAGKIEKGELIRNGNFLDSTEWIFNAYSPAKASGTIQNEQYIIKVDTIGTEAWQAQLQQRGLTLAVGKTYKLQFDAYASHPRNILINLGEQDSPYRSAIGGPQPCQLGTQKETIILYLYVDPATLESGFRFNDIRMEFNCGKETGTVYLDNVSLIEVESGKCLITKPFIGSVLKAGSEFNVQWINEPVATIDIEFSSDSGVTWVKVADSIANLQAYLWSVPAISSKKCKIRIKNTENDSVVGTSAIFEINKFGVPIKIGELVTNGNFSNGTTGWNTSFVDARGGAEVNKGVYSINVENPGDSLNSMILSQGEMNVQGNTPYVLSFDAFVNGTRDMRVKLIGDDSLIFLDTTIIVPTLMSNVKFKLTPTADAVAKVEFHIGGSMASVSIDNVSFHDASWTAIEKRSFNADQKPAYFSILNGCYGKVTFLTGKNVQGRIAIYNLNGSLIRILNVSEKVLWDGRDINGVNVARGTYLARLKDNNGSIQVNKFIFR
ncbi:MAG TPA: carbohydrate binding domain-containing protein [Chitinispirillaceae bacterium]|nr:carbohydrate binding domain-containing protein [Chitinispirillaceae bacterium]